MPNYKQIFAKFLPKTFDFYFYLCYTYYVSDRVTDYRW